MVNAVAPSLIETDMTSANSLAATARIPIGRQGSVDEVAQAVLMVVGNAHMTGQTVRVNGGLYFN